MGSRFWALHGVLPVLLLLPLLLAFEYWQIDFWVADRFYDPTSGYWLGGGSWWAKGLIHTGGARLVIFIFACSVALWLASHCLDHLRHWRHPALFVAVGILLSTTLVAVLKHYTNVDCPEELLRYGGDRAYVHVFADKPAGAARGGCFPGGHSSGAFSLFTIYFLLRERNWAYARLALVAVLTLGVVYSAGQWTRGEHFPSHDAWSALLCWYVTLMLYAVIFRGHIFHTQGALKG